MELRSVSQPPDAAGTGKEKKPKKAPMTAAEIKDKLVKINREKSDLMKKIAELRINQAEHLKSKKNVNRIRLLTKIGAIAGGIAFGAGTFMASGPIFASGGIIGAGFYIANGFFGGRTQWFERQANEAKQESVNLEKHYAVAEKEAGKIEKVKADTDALVMGLQPKKGKKISDEGDFIKVGGVRLKKARTGLMRYMDDLFKPLED